MINLEDIRKEKKVTLVDLADLLGVRYQTISDKIEGKSDFKFKEALKIQEKFFPEYEIKFLFSNGKEVRHESTDQSNNKRERRTAG